MLLTLEEIKNQIEQSLGIPDLAAKTKKNEVPLWRGMYCKIARERTDRSLVAIGAEIDLVHSMVIYWRNRFEYLFYTRKDIEEKYWTTLIALDELSDKKKVLLRIDSVAENIVYSMLVS